MTEPAMRRKNISKTKHAEPQSSGKVRRLDNFKMALGIGMNWIDLDSGVMYHIQDYMDALKDPHIPKEQKPTKIRMTKVSDGSLIGWAEEWQVQDKMKDPEADPRY